MITLRGHKKTTTPLSRTKCPVSAVFCALLLTACASQAEKAVEREKSEKKAEKNLFTQTVRVRTTDTTAPFDQEGAIVEKKVATIIADNRAIWINNVRVKDLAELKQLLKKAANPVISIATHTCLKGSQAAEIMAIAQEATDTPLAYSSYGEPDDEQCHQTPP